MKIALIYWQCKLFNLLMIVSIKPHWLCYIFCLKQKQWSQGILPQGAGLILSQVVNHAEKQKPLKLRLNAQNTNNVPGSLKRQASDPNGANINAKQMKTEVC